jgi:hypothetical protein
MKRGVLVITILALTIFLGYAQPYILKDQVIASTDKITFTIRQAVDDPIWGQGFQVIMENKTGKNVMFTWNDVGVDGFSIDPFWAKTVASGKKATSTINFSTKSLMKYGITALDEVEFKLRAYDADDIFAGDVYSEKHTIYPTGYTKETLKRPEIKISSNDTIIVENSNCLVAVVGEPYTDSIWGFTVPLYIENRTTYPIMVSWDNVSVNDFMIDPFFSSEVPSGQKKLTSISFSKKSLEESFIDEVEKIEFDMRVYNSEDWFAGNLVDNKFHLKL